MLAARNAHVAAFAFPFGSHPAPLLHLVQCLAAAAPEVDFSFFSTKESNRNVLRNTNLARNLKAYDVDDGVPAGHVLSGNPLEVVEMFIKATPENFKHRLEEVVKETGVRITCLLTDAFLWFASEMAAELGIPWVALWTAGPTAVALHIYTDVIRTKLGGDRNPAKTLDFLPGMSAIRVGDLTVEILDLSTPFSGGLHSMGRVLPGAAAVVLNSFDGIDPDVEDDLKSKFQKFLTVGPPPLPPPAEDKSGCLTWLNHHSTAAVAYISFGSMLTPPPPELLAIAEAIEAKQMPYLWALENKSRRQLLQEFCERTKSVGKVVDWAPQAAVLAHPAIGLFLTHCGWNSVVESIMGGVPMICRPFLGDQAVNRRRVEETWRIGVAVDGGVFSKGSLGMALDVVRSEQGKKMRENIERLQKRAFSAIEENGSSTLNLKSLIDIATFPHSRN